MAGAVNGRAWTEAELQVLQQSYADTRTEDLAHKIGRDVGSVYRKAAQLGLRKSDVYLASPAARRLRRGGNVGAAFRFPKGHVPANKGLRRPGWAAGRMRETQFKPGSKPQTWVSIGTEVRDPDGYLKRKVRDDAPRGFSRRNWKFVHVLMWEEHRGPVPSGHAVVFRNGDKTDIRIENLELVRRSDLMRRNSYHNRYPKEIGLAIQLRGALVRQINMRNRREKQDQ